MSRFVLTAQLQLQAPNNVAQVVRQIQNQLNNVNVNVQVQGAAQAQRQLQQVTTQTQAATTAADRMGRAFAISIRRFAAFSIATRAVGLFTSTLSDAIKTAIDFEREMVRVSQITGESIGKLRFLTKAITDLSTGLGVSSKDLLTTGQLLLQAGVNAKDTEIALKTLAKAALAPNFDSLSETTEGAIAILAQFQEGVGALEKQLGAINAVAGAFAVEAGDLIDVIRRAGGVFKASGGDLNELIALFTSVRATTRESAESIGTGLRTIFTRIQRPKTIEFLKQFGVELVDLEGKFVGPFEAVRRLSTALSGLGEGDITFIRIAEELGGFRQIGKVLPLLQQFSTAQAALNVAQKAGNSLTTDAATAQQALAVRIVKVKEEFLALIRSVTETTTFQVMANTALSLASALIKIGEAIKPLLPLLAAVAAVNFAKGIGTFAGGLMRGMQSGRTYSTGGKVHHFARGGMVPGTGNRDTVPAMLQPGEFVIRKSSVNKLGADNLAAMNENKLNKGGISTLSARNALIGQRRLTPAEMMRASKRAGYDIERLNNGRIALSRNGKIYHNNLTDDEASKLLASMGTGYAAGGIVTNNRNNYGSPLNQSERRKLSALMNPPKGTRLSAEDKKLRDELSARKNISATEAPDMKTAYLKDGRIGGLFLQKGSGGTKGITKILQGQEIPGFPDVKQIKGNVYTGLLDSKASISLRSEIEPAISTAVENASINTMRMLEIPPLNINEKLASQNAVKRIDISSIEGHIFEAFISAMSGANLSDPGASFDFINPSADAKKRLKNIFGPDPVIGKLLDAKRSLSTDTMLSAPNSIANKTVSAMKAGLLAPSDFIMKNLGGIIEKFAAGGGVGTDTVPALLTPGEFVVNRSSAQRIGYGNLNRMNKVGRYAKGGVVQGFNAGTPTGGVKTKGGVNIPGFSTQPFNLLEKAILSLVTNFSSTAQISNKVSAKWAMLDKLSPALAHALDRYISSLNLSNQDALELTSAYNSLANRLLKKKASVDEATAVLAPYIHALHSATNAHKNTAAAAASAPTASPTASPTLPRRQPGTQPIAPIQGPAPSSTQQNTQAVVNNTKAQRGAAKSAMEVVNNNKMFAASMTVSLIQGFLPAVDQNSGALLKLTHSFFGMISTITAVGFALEAFGVQLNKKTLTSMIDFGMGKGLNMRSLAKGRSALMSMGLSKGFSTQVVGATQAVAKFAGPVLAAAAATYVLIKGANALASAFFDVSAQLKTAIEKGNVQNASQLAGKQYDLEAANTTRAAFGTGGAVIGGVIGSIFGPIGTAAGAAIGAAVGAAAGIAIGTVLANVAPEWAEAINVFFGGNTRDSAVKLAAAQAGAVKTQKALDQAQKESTRTMEDFQNGTISAAEALRRITASTSEAVTQENRALDFATSNTQNMSQGAASDIGSQAYWREVGGWLTAGYVDTAEERNTRLGEESAKQIRDSSAGTAKAFEMASGARTATMRMGVATGQSREDIRNRALGVGTENDLLARQRKLANRARILGERGDTEGAEAAHEAFMQVTEQIKITDRELANIEKEMKRTAAALNAMNLGLRGPEATATAMSASMNRFVAGLEVGGSTFAANAEFLSQAMTSAAQSMDPNEIKAAMQDVSDNLRRMGADPSKFEANTQAFVQAQQRYNDAFKKVVGNLNEAYKAGRNVKNAPDDLKKAFAEELTVGLGKEAKENLTAIINGMELSQAEVEQILGGNLQIFGDKLSEAGQKQFEAIVKIAQERQQAEQVVIGLIHKRADAERSLAQAQKDAVDLYMEGRDVQAKYGGRTVSTEERRAAIVAKANTGAANAGIGALRTGSVAELRQRQTQIVGGFANIEQRRSQDGGMQGTAGAKASETQRALEQAQKDQVDTIRSLIKLEEEELKIIQEKNKLEKDSLESLISGDIDKFFEQQAAIGAQAAIATGDMDAANMFGAKAVGDAFKDMQRQMEAGVQTMFGQRLGGAGGLLEQGAGAALAARGITDPRMAQRLAGTTAEEEASKARLQELGGLLGEAGAAGVAMAEMQVQTATINVINAELKLTEIEERGKRAAEAAGMYRGGVVYANRGMFVPRGTDTVPAMLTPGEFVVRREAVNRGNNLQLLQAINSGNSAGGMARGGKVGYYNNGGKVQYKQLGGGIGSTGGVGIDPQIITSLQNVFTTFVTGFNESIKNLQNTKLQIKMDSVNVNVNVTGGSMLNQISAQAKQEIMDQVVQKLKNEYGVGNDGKLKESPGNLPRP